MKRTHAIPCNYSGPVNPRKFRVYYSGYDTGKGLAIARKERWFEIIHTPSGLQLRVDLIVPVARDWKYPQMRKYVLRAVEMYDWTSVTPEIMRNDTVTWRRRVRLIYALAFDDNAALADLVSEQFTAGGDI